MPKKADMNTAEARKLLGTPLAKCAGERPINNLEELTRFLRELARIFVPGREIPQKYQSAPRRIPPKSHPLADVVNAILNQSRVIQSGNIPGHQHLGHFILSTSIVSIGALLKIYMREVLGQKFVDKSTQLVHGILLWPPSSVGVYDKYEGVPHVWLEILGHPIDNTFVHTMEGQIEDETYYEGNKNPRNYVKEDYLNTKRKLYSGHEDGTSHVFMHNHKVIRACMNSDNDLEKMIVYLFKFYDLHLGLKMYDHLMRDWLHLKYGVMIMDLDEKWKWRCWTCDKDRLLLKRCQTCKCAMYCDEVCQARDWKKCHKLLHKTDAILEEDVVQAWQKELDRHKLLKTHGQKKK